MRSKLLTLQIKIWNRKFNFSNSVEVMTLIKKVYLSPLSRILHYDIRHGPLFSWYSWQPQLFYLFQLLVQLISSWCSPWASVQVWFLIPLSINFCKHFAEATLSCAQPRLVCKDVLTISQVLLEVRFHLFPLRNSNCFQSDLLSNGCCDPEIIKLLKSLCYSAYSYWE